MNSKKVVAMYSEAMKKGDFATVRSVLADNLDFQGPIAKHSNADDLVKDLQNLGKIVQGMELKKEFVDGKDVCLIYDLITKMGVAPVAEWHHVEGDKITSIRVFFDARPFVPQK